MNKKLGESMMETIFNIFLPFDGDDRCDQALYVAHNTTLHDEAAISFLQGRVEEDFLNASRVQLAKPFTRETYYAHCRIGDGHHLYDEVFQAASAPVDPLFVTSIVINGKVRVDVSGHHGDPNFYLIPEVVGDAHMDDWLLKYREGNALNLSRLIHDDYFLGVKLTFNAKLYVSSLKLLLSCIDSISYIDFGDQKTPTFIGWLRKYADLTKVGVTPEELWELRNGVLHMTNLDSRQVTRKKVRRISIRIGGEGGTAADGIYYFNFYSLIQVFAAALQTWLASYNTDREKFAAFVERYDKTISDSRQLWRPVESAK
ncbi:MAG: hypothetical protein EOS76_19650 [Mesorhizobium sp.]|uniref:hypothetical protein n=1 Tax=Mesorhizobium sp. TaxID=1871066 RepID=UPI000FE62A92|nr:hypothetical protein [Mesorhizobium sp.]RWE16967.1 MAG: hypothetical protein EOS76_19650 [Mesorhizobium sp.]